MVVCCQLGFNPDGAGISSIQSRLYGQDTCRWYLVDCFGTEPILTPVITMAGDPITVTTLRMLA